MLNSIRHSRTVAIGNAARVPISAVGYVAIEKSDATALPAPAGQSFGIRGPHTPGQRTPWVSLLCSDLGDDSMKIRTIAMAAAALSLAASPAIAEAAFDRASAPSRVKAKCRARASCSPCLQLRLSLAASSLSLTTTIRSARKTLPANRPSV